MADYTPRMKQRYDDEIVKAMTETLAAGDETHNPFLSYAFLSALEDSGCVSRRTGWLPLHVSVERDGARLGVAPCYLKSHSQGEYVFDHGWADAYMKAGGRYYPKLQIAVPFTPATGPRLLIRDGTDAATVAAPPVPISLELAATGDWMLNVSLERYVT